MSLAAVRVFFRERMEGLGYTEHDQPFQPTVLAENIQDGSFHMETGVISSGPANQIVHDFEFPITIRVYKKGFADVLSAYDKIHEEADTILADLLDPLVRIGTIIKDIVPDTVQPLPLDETNDNVIVLELVFTARLELCYKT